MVVGFVQILVLNCAMVSLVRLVVSTRPLHGVVRRLNASISRCEYCMLGMVLQTEVAGSRPAVPWG